jgi:hypothetical protein
MYGDGLSDRSARYSDNGDASKGIDMRCEITTCMMSPAAMYSFARATACLKFCSPNWLVAADFAAPVASGMRTGSRNLRRSAVSRSRVRAYASGCAGSA